MSVHVADLGNESSAAEFVASVGLGVSASDLPPGELTVGSCQDAGSSGRFCTEWWWHDGFVVGVVLTGDIGTSETEQLLVAVVPTVVDTLGEQAPVDAGEPSDPALDGARQGLADYLDETRPARLDDDVPGCPAIAIDDVHAALAANALDVELDDWVTEFAGDPEALEPDPIGVICSGDDTDVDLLVNVWVVDFGDPDTADEWLIASGISSWPAVDDVLPGALTFAGCFEMAVRCGAFANADGLVLGLALSSDDVAVDADTIEELLRALVPEILAALAQ